jgi:flagellar FliL protein
MSAAAAAADATPVRSGGKKKLVVMVAVAAIVLAGGGVGALLYMKKQRAAAEAAAAEDGDADSAPVKHEKKKEHAEKPVFIPMDPFVVNLADHDADRYAQIGIVLEVPDEHVGEDIKNYLPAIRNNILLLLAHKSSADLAGGDGKELLARQIRHEALRAMGEDVEDVDDAPAVQGASASAAAAAARKKKKKQAEAADAPIRSVQFSSFIIR